LYLYLAEIEAAVTLVIVAGGFGPNLMDVIILSSLGREWQEEALEVLWRWFIRWRFGGGGFGGGFFFGGGGFSGSYLVVDGKVFN
jgi:hypothetical protein